MTSSIGRFERLRSLLVTLTTCVVVWGLWCSNLESLARYVEIRFEVSLWRFEEWMDILSPSHYGAVDEQRVLVIGPSEAREAFTAAGDPTRYPEQIAAGLRPWRAGKLYMPANQTSKPVSINLATYDRLLGRTYMEIGTEARSMHKCQGMAQLLALPGPSSTSCQLADSSIPDQLQRTERSLFDNIDTTIGGLATFVGGGAPRPSRRPTGT